MADSDPTPPDRQPPGKGCNLIAFALVLVAVLIFAVAAWVRAPSSAPAPVNTGTPPTAPASTP